MTTLKNKTVAKAKPKSATKAASKPPQKAPKAKESVTIPEGIAGNAKVVEVPLKDINLEDARFQYRVDRDRFGDIVKSLEADGQQVPIVLWGEKKPYLIIDGHRRTRAAAEIGLASIKAIIRDNLSEKEAYRLAFLENGKRKNFTKLDLAHAVWVLVNRRKMTQEAAAEELGIGSADKAARLLKLLAVSEELQKAVRDGDISMHHALLLNEHKSIKLDELLPRIKKGELSVRKLAKELGSGTKKKGRKPNYFKKVGEGFFLSPIRFNPKAPETTRDDMLKALKKAIEAIEGAKVDEPKGAG